MARAAADHSVFHAIADPTRRRILDVLRDGERTVTDLMQVAGGGPVAAGRARTAAPRRPARGHRRGGEARAERRISQPAFSQHLAVLRRAGLVAARKSGRARVYSFRPEPLRQVLDWIAAYDRFWTDRLGRLGEYLDREDPRPRQAPEEFRH